MKGEALSIIIGGMDQSKLTLPQFKLKPKDTGIFLDTKITGVLVHGKCFDAYSSEPQVCSDSNLNLTCLHTTLMKLRGDAKDGVIPRKLYLQVGGGAENKNRWMISYLSLLVAIGTFDLIKMSFLPVGHPHEDIVQVFSRIAVHLNRNDAITMDEFVQAITKSFIKDDKPPEVIIIGAAFDFKNLLKDRLPDLSSWTDNLCYRFAENLASGRVELHYKFLSQSPHYFGNFHDEPVASFKALASKDESDMNAYCRRMGIEMPKGVATGEPGIAEKHNFSEAEDANKTSSKKGQVSTSNIPKYS